MSDRGGAAAGLHAYGWEGGRRSYTGVDGRGQGGGLQTCPGEKKWPRGQQRQPVLLKTWRGRMRAKGRLAWWETGNGCGRACIVARGAAG